MKICNNCGNNFPNTLLIEGIKRNLKNRKYCLDCSPFNLHNTTKIEKIECKCLNCDSNLNGNKRKYCSNKCKKVYHEKNSDKNSYYYQVLRGLHRKYKLIELKGGKCCKCGYNKNISALDFHHKNSIEKDIPLNSRMLSNSKWENILIEVDKCILLCSNCHREEHYPDNTFDNIKKILSDNNLI